MALAIENDSPETLEQLKSGAVIISGTRFDESGGSVRIRILMNANAEKIWNIIAQCSKAYQYLDGLEECEILVDEQERALTRQVIDGGLFSPGLDYTFATRRDPFRRKDVSLVDGNLKQLDAYWKFTPLDTGTIVEHEVHVQLGFPAPRWLIRMKLKKELPRMLLCIRGLSNGSHDAKMLTEDLSACHEPADVPRQ